MQKVFNFLRGVDIINKDLNAKLSEKLFNLNRRCLIHFKCILSILFPRLFCLSTILFIILIIVLVSLEFIVYQVGLVPSKFYKVLSEKNLDVFWHIVLISIGLISVNSFVKSLVDYLSKLLGLIWRKSLTKQIHEQYFANKNFYYIQKQDQLSNNGVTRQEYHFVTNDKFKLDNPDQRITQDIDYLLDSITIIIPKLLISPFLIFYYGYKAFQTAGYSGPLSVFVYFVIGALLNGIFMSPISAIVYLQDKIEGNFRYKHMSIRTHAESIAFLNSGSNELTLTNSIFRNLLTISYRRSWKEFLLNIVINTLQYFGAILSYLILAIPVFTGKYDNLDPKQLGSEISSYAFICNYLVYQFTQLYNLSSQVSIIAGNTHRVGQLIDFTSKNNETVDVLSDIIDQLDDSWCFEMKNVTIMTPDKKILIKDLCVKLEKNLKILVTGHSGCGKTSLFRCISGLWKSYLGEIKVNFKNFNPSFIFFLPQIPYFTTGSLMEQITYPFNVDSIDQSKINEVKEFLRKYSLENLLNMVNGNLNLQPDFYWSSVLSSGEQQRLSFLRLIYHRPKYALLDEFTSSVDQETEKLMYEDLIQFGITFISIAHRDTVRKYHQVELNFQRDGNYEIKSI